MTLVNLEITDNGHNRKHNHFSYFQQKAH